MNGRKEGKPIKTSFQASFILQIVLHVSSNIYSKPKRVSARQKSIAPTPLSIIGFCI